MARKSCSLDPIPSNLLKFCFSDLVPIITKIVNRSLESGEVPLPMKRAILSPLLKKPSLDTELYPSLIQTGIEPHARVQGDRKSSGYATLGIFMFNWIKKGTSVCL